MSYANTHRLEKGPAALPSSPIAVPGEDEKIPPLPTEGIKGITEIIGKAVELTAVITEAVKSSPIQLGNVVTGNNATTPPPAQRVSGLNAGQLAGIESALNRAAAPAASRSNGVEIGKPTPKESPESSTKPTPNAKAAQPAPVSSSTSEMTYTFKRAKKKTFPEMVDATTEPQPTSKPTAQDSKPASDGLAWEPINFSAQSTVPASVPETQNISPTTPAAASGPDV